MSNKIKVLAISGLAALMTAGLRHNAMASVPLAESQMGGMHPGMMHSGTMHKMHMGKGRAKVVAMDMKRKSIMLAHGDIPGMMPAMCMSYPVSNIASMKGIHIGDSVMFTMQYVNGIHVVTGLSVISKRKAVRYRKR